MLRLAGECPWLPSPYSYVSTKDEADKVIVFDRGTAAGPLVFAFNFHPTASYTDYRLGAPEGGLWAVALDTDAAAVGGYARVDPGGVYAADQGAFHDRPASFKAYLPARTALVFRKKQV